MRAVFSIILSVFAAFLIQAHDYRSGDLIFIASTETAFTEAIATATGDAIKHDTAIGENDNKNKNKNKKSLTFTHVAIIAADDPSRPTVIEADPQAGVREIALSDFLSSEMNGGRKPIYVVKRLTGAYPYNEILARARSFIGQEYDWWFLPDNGKMYCSELIYESYVDDKGKHIFETQPMNFRAPDGTMPEFWINLYNRLEMEVPEGLPGTNPNDLSRSPLLIEINF